MQHLLLPNFKFYGPQPNCMYCVGPLTNVAPRASQTLNAPLTATEQGDGIKAYNKRSANGDELRAKLATAKIEDGNLRAAVRILSSDDQPAEYNNETVKDLADKHPAAPSESEFMPDSATVDFQPVQVTDREVSNAISSFPPGSSAGLDSLSPQHLKDMIGNDGDPALLTNLTSLVNVLLKGSLPVDIVRIIYGGKLIALRKKDGGIRPITVGYVIRRIVAKCANQSIINRGSLGLLPRQLGVGVKGGIEAAVHTTRRFFESIQEDETKIVVKLDFKNAFNSIRRDKMLSIVAKSAPCIYAFCKNVYSIHTSLKFHDTEILSATGVQQGDPLGSLLFCLTIQPILDRLNSDLIIGYLDDVTLGGDVQTVNDDLTVITTEGAQLGLQLNKSKCEIATRNTFDSHVVSAFAGFKIVDIRDAQLLGSPIISDRGLDAVLDEKCDEVQVLINRLKFLSAHHSLVIIKHCIGVSKIMHILRTNKCHDNDKLETFDSIIRAGLETF